VSERPAPGTHAHRLAHAALRETTKSHLVRNGLVAAVLLFTSLLFGMAGYHWLVPMSWVDAFLNAAMLLGGMGPVATLDSDTAKLFAGLYAIYCGVIFIATAGLLIAPLSAYFLHRLHLDQPQ
jgi:hypothetical protein